MPMKNPPHPGEVIREEVLRPFDLSITKAAAILGVRRATLSDLTNGKAAVSAEMALRLEKAFREHGFIAAHAGRLRCRPGPPPRSRDRRPPL